MVGYIRWIDGLSKALAHSFGWCIVMLTLGTSYEVFMRYVLNQPTSWAYDMSYMFYGALFMMAGAYTLSKILTCAVTLFTVSGRHPRRPKLS